MERGTRKDRDSPWGTGWNGYIFGETNGAGKGGAWNPSVVTDRDGDLPTAASIPSSSPAGAPPLIRENAREADGGDELTMKGNELALLMWNASKKDPKQQISDPIPKVPYITRAGRISNPVERYQAGES